MSGGYKITPVVHYVNGKPVQSDYSYIVAHKPEPNGSGSSARTRGSLAAASGQNDVETALNSPPFSGRPESVLSQTNGERPKCPQCGGPLYKIYGGWQCD